MTGCVRQLSTVATLLAKEVRRCDRRVMGGGQARVAERQSRVGRMSTMCPRGGEVVPWEGRGDRALDTASRVLGGDWVADDGGRVDF